MDRFYIGVDLGGTNLRIAVYDESAGKMIEVEKMAFIHSRDIQTEIFQNLEQPIERICNKMEKEKKSLAGIGLSLAALFNRQTGVIVKWPNNQVWNNVPIKQLLEKRFHVPVILEDDANAAAFGELLVRSGKEKQSLAYVTVSTGIGAGIIINNEVYTGNSGWAGELGHIKVTEKPRICTCGARGCLQAVASGTAILKIFKETNEFQAMKEKDSISVEDISKMAKQGVYDAQKVFTDAGKFIGNAIANLAILFDIPLIVLGGGVIKAGDIIVNPIKETALESLQSKRKIQIECSELKDKNGVLGAVALIDNYVNKESTIDFKGITEWKMRQIN